MKNLLTSTLRSSLLAFAVGVLASTSSAVAQSSSTTVKAVIPFAFQVGSQHMPAGTYDIDLMSPQQVLLRGPGHKGGFVMVHSAEVLQAPNTSTIVFDRYGNKYFLRQIWQAGATEGLECPKGRAEKAAVVAQNEQAATSVELAFNAEPLK